MFIVILLLIHGATIAAPALESTHHMGKKERPTKSAAYENQRYCQPKLQHVWQTIREAKDGLVCSAKTYADRFLRKTKP
jgi:hypothetical protein